MQRSLQHWQGEAVTVEYRTFLLNPAIPSEGYDFAPYMQAKFGGRISLQQAFDGPRRLGAATGLVFNMDRISKAPNSILSHCLIALAPADRRSDLVDDVYAAYFEHGQDIGDLETLLGIGQKHGLEAGKLRAELTGGAVKQQVLREADEAYQLGVNAVPLFVFNHRYGLSGAQPPEAILNALRQVAAREQGEPA